jgi:hypothetical protein
VAMKNTTFGAVTPCNSIDIYWRFGETYCLSVRGWRAIQARTRREEATSWVTLVGFRHITPSYIPEDRTSHNHCSDNLRHYIDKWISEVVIFLITIWVHVKLVAQKFLEILRYTNKLKSSFW